MNLNALLLAVLILAPIVCALAAWLAPGERRRAAAVTVGCVLTMGAGVAVVARAPLDCALGAWTSSLALLLELGLGLVVLGIGWRIPHRGIAFFAVVQLVLTLAEAVLARRAPDAGAGPRLVVDGLAALLVLIVSLVGAVIVFFALGYMRQHREHAPATAAGEGRFFLFLLGFLGVMNLLVLADDLRWLTAAWEMTTLCSFFLIRYDGTPEARANAARALWINSFGGAAMAGAGVWALAQGGVATLSGVVGLRLIAPMALLCLAAFTKSAQMPFQSWLLGAMVAPTPVSALLHAATMVKAGSYLVLRLAPGLAGSRSVYLLALAGAFTFMVTAALAVSQSNAKKVLAYSTISNLGLVVACAGINTPLAYAAAVMVLCFHALSKGLLFLCVGTVEQRIGSRDIEDMGVIFYRLPLTTSIMLAGMVSMLMPPFGMLLSKWMAIEASTHQPLVLLFIVMGSALTVLFWAKWLGRIQTTSYHAAFKPEPLSGVMRASLLALVAAVLAGAGAALPVYRHYVEPLARAAFRGATLPAEQWQLLESAGRFMIGPLLLPLAAVLLAGLFAGLRVGPRFIRQPFLCGENAEAEAPRGEGGLPTYSFRSAGDRVETAWAGTLYLRAVFNEARITPWANVLAWLILLAIFGETGVL